MRRYQLQDPWSYTLPVVVHCYNGGAVFPLIPLGQIPVDMQIQVGSGSNGEVFLQASFSEINTQTGQTRPLAVQFLVPEPSSIVLCAVGIVGLALRYCRRTHFEYRSGKTPSGS
jgi:hypothetical protein